MVGGISRESEEAQGMLTEMGIEMVNSCQDLENGLYGVLVRPSLTNDLYNEIKYNVVMSRPESIINTMCVTYNPSTLYDRELLKYRIYEISDFLQYFTVADKHNREKMTKKVISCSTIEDYEHFNQLPTYFSIGIERSMNNMRTDQKSEPIYIEVEAKSTMDCDDGRVPLIKKIIAYTKKRDHATHTRKNLLEYTQHNDTLARKRRGIGDVMISGTSLSEVYEHINIDTENVNLIQDWGQSLKGALEEAMNNEQQTIDTLKTDLSTLITKLHLQEARMEAGTKSLGMQLQQATINFNEHTSLIDLEILHGHLMRSVRSLTESVNGNTHCALHGGIAGCSKGRPTAKIDITGQLSLDTIIEDVELRETEMFYCVPTEYGLSKRNGAFVIHRSEPSHILLSSGEIVNTEPEMSEFVTEYHNILPRIMNCYINSDLESFYLVSCDERTEIKVGTRHITLERLQVFQFQPTAFPIKINHKTIKREDFENFVQYFSGLNYARNTMTRVDFSPTVYKHMTEELGLPNSTETWHLDLPSLVVKHPRLLHYVTISGAIMGVFAIIIILIIIRVFSRLGLMGIWKKLVNVFMCQWARRRRRRWEHGHYEDVPTAPPMEHDNSQGSRKKPILKTRSNFAPRIFSQRRPAIEIESFSDSADGLTAADRFERLKIRASDAEKIAKRYRERLRRIESHEEQLKPGSFSK